MMISFLFNRKLKLKMNHLYCIHTGGKVRPWSPLGAPVEHEGILLLCGLQWDQTELFSTDDVHHSTLVFLEIYIISFFSCTAKPALTKVNTSLHSLGVFCREL